MVTTLQTLIRVTPTKAVKTYKGNYQNRDKKDNGSTSKKVCALHRYIKYTTINTAYTQTLECSLSKAVINIPLVKTETKSTWNHRN